MNTTRAGTGARFWEDTNALSQFLQSAGFKLRNMPEKLDPTMQRVALQVLGTIAMLDPNDEQAEPLRKVIIEYLGPLVSLRSFCESTATLFPVERPLQPYDVQKYITSELDMNKSADVYFDAVCESLTKENVNPTPGFYHGFFLRAWRRYAKAGCPAQFYQNLRLSLTTQAGMAASGRGGHHKDACACSKTGVCTCVHHGGSGCHNSSSGPLGKL